MNQYTDWFIANESEAEAIANIGSDETDVDFDDWPHLAMKSVLNSELMALWAILRGSPGKWESVNGKVLVQLGDVNEDGIGEEGLTTVSRVIPEFVTGLAKLGGKPLWEVVKEWLRDESMADWETSSDVEAVLEEMASFAQRAEREAKPVLQMTTV